ncbi:MAG TPA: biotin/lipoyl-binding protein, partial [Phenylobacterium sp.]|nr:biotin/lipoyl-binding protein [Phenylobacterium sp.]
QRLAERAWPGRGRDAWTVALGDQDIPVRLSPTAQGLEVQLVEEGRTLALTDVVWRPGVGVFAAHLDGQAFSAQVRPAAEGFVVRHRAAEAQVRVLTETSAKLHRRLPPRQAADTAKLVLSPMPGLVVSLDVTEGQEVKAGETVAIIEAMKMQNIIRAERDGVVKSVGAKAGDSVAADEVLVEFA